MSTKQMLKLGDEVYVQRDCWGPPVPGKYIGISGDKISVILDGETIINFHKNLVHLTWTESLKRQLSNLTTEKNNGIMKPLVLGLLKCLHAKFLPNSNFFRDEVNKASYMNDIDKEIRKISNNGAAS
jgi:hypothetical protein